MSLIISGKNGDAIFDIPSSKDVYKSDFVDRRIITNAGKSILSEKNIPIKPSTEFKYRKCYILHKIDLFKSQKETIKRDLQNLSYFLSLGKETDYLYQLNHFYPYDKLRQKKSDYYDNWRMNK